MCWDTRFDKIVEVHTSPNVITAKAGIQNTAEIAEIIGEFSKTNSETNSVKAKLKCPTADKVEMS